MKPNKNHVPILMLAVVSAMLSGCQIAPKYAKPAPPVPQAYPVATEAAAKAVAEIGWRDFFRDPELQSVIATALANNRDLKTATLQIAEARALYDIQEADKLPTVNATGGVTRSRQLLAGTVPGNRTVYQVGATMTAFEIDLYGRVKNLSEAALAQFFATEEVQRAVHILLVGEVAKAWLTERALTEQLQLATKTREGREASYALVKKRFDAGIANALELRQSDTLVQSARVAQLSLKRLHDQSVNALTLLVGSAVKTPAAEASLVSQQVIADIGAGLPSELIAQHPDIRAAEQRLRAQQANIAAARAAFFPRITLTAGLGLASLDMSNLFSGTSQTWSFAPLVTLPIFDAGRNKASLNLAEVRSEMAVAAYEKTIQLAFREVADALAARATLTDELGAQQAVRKAQSERLDLARARYQNGIANYLEVLDAERELFTAEQQLVQTHLLKLTNAIDLYRTLGGGLNETSK